MKRRHTTPRYYARNAAIQAQRRFLRTGKTEAERLDDHREATANVLVLCILAAIYDKYGIVRLYILPLLILLSILFFFLVVYNRYVVLVLHL